MIARNLLETPLLEHGYEIVVLRIPLIKRRNVQPAIDPVKLFCPSLSDLKRPSSLVRNGRRADYQPQCQGIGQRDASPGTLPTSNRNSENGPMLPIASSFGPEKCSRFSIMAFIGPYSPLPISTHRGVSALIT